MLKNAALSLAAAVFVAAIARAPPASAQAQPVPTPTPRGATISVVARLPAGTGPFPAVILGPGTGSLQQKINDVVATALVDQGFAVYRFDWAYYVRDKKAVPSDTDRAPEIEDFSTVVALAKADRRIDASRILVGGKSRGTIIAWRVLRADPSLKGVIQLTPVCTKDGFTPAQLYPDIEQENRPSLWISGDADPACQSRTLYGFLSKASPNARISAVRGDHGLASDASSTLAGALVADFARAVLTPTAP